MRAWFFLAIAPTLLAGCGGGGDQKGECVFGPIACSYGTAPGSTSAPTSGSGSGSAAGLIRSGTGDSVFAIPSNVTVVRIQAQFSGSSSTFFVDVAGRSLVSAAIGTSQTPEAFDGTYIVTPGAQVEITNSNGVTWSVTSTSVGTSSTAGLFTKAGIGDTVFDLPARASRYRIQASYAGTIQTFFVDSSGRSLVSAAIGTSQTPPAFAGTYTLPSGSRIEITGSSGVSWSFNETP